MTRQPLEIETLAGVDLDRRPRRVEAEQFDLFNPPSKSPEISKSYPRHHAYIISGDLVDPRHTLVVDGTRAAERTEPQ
jgi:hypothetical protein